jgi:hypothetical protein
MKQWHPIFAQMLRPVVEKYYDVQTTFPVGDTPREADFVLLRRTATQPPPFQGLWQHLTPWSVLEFKGPTVSPRARDIERLIELGLGIDRQLREGRVQQMPSRVLPEEVSFWYLANHLGRRFLRDAERKLGGLEALGAGLWRSRLLGRLVFLVSSIDLPVEEDSLPLHIVGKEPLDTERAVAQFVAEQPLLQQLYGGWVASLHSKAWKEIEAMVRRTGKGLNIDLEAAIDAMGLDRIIEQVGIDRVIEQVGIDRVIEQVGIDQLIEQVGIDSLIQHLGKKEVIRRIGVDDFLANLSPAERRELKRRLQ